MKTKVLASGAVIRYYEDNEELPINRSIQWANYLIWAGALDLTIESQAQRIGQLIAKVRAGEKIDNDLLNLYMSLNAVDKLVPPPEALAFAVLVGYVDNEPVNDLSDSGLSELLLKIKPTVKEVTDLLIETKKKFQSSDQAVNSDYVRYLNAVANAALYPEKAEELTPTINRLEKALIGESPCLQSGDANNPIERNKAAVEELYFLLEQRGVQGPETLSVYAFHRRIDAINKSAARSTSGAPEYS